MEQPTKKLLFNTKVKFLGYFLFIVAFGFLVLLVTIFSDGLSVWGWIIASIFLLFYLLAVSTLKKMEVYETGIKMKYLFRNKSVYISYREIVDYKLETVKILFKKRKQLAFKTKDDVFNISALLYTNVNKIYEQIQANIG